MNRGEAEATLATWREMLADPNDRQLYPRAVQALAAAANWFETECTRLAGIIRADQARVVELERFARDHAPARQRPPKAFANEVDAIADARMRAQCVVFMEERSGVLAVSTGGNTLVRSYWSVPLEAAYLDGILRDRWKHATPVELDPAQPLVRPPATGTPLEPVQLPRRTA